MPTSKDSIEFTVCYIHQDISGPMLKAILLIPSICQSNSRFPATCVGPLRQSLAPNLAKWCKMFKDVQRLQIELNSQSGKGLDNSQKPKLPDCFEVTIAEHFLSEMFCAWIDLISWSYSSRSTAKYQKKAPQLHSNIYSNYMQGPIKGVPPRSSNCERLLKQTLGISRFPAKHPKRPMKSQWETITTISSRDLRQFHWAVSHGLLSLKAFAFWQGIPIIPVKKNRFGLYLSVFWDVQIRSVYHLALCPKQ